MAAKATAGRSTMPPITRAARIRSRKPKVDTLPPMGRPTTPARRNTPLNARRVATIQTTVWSRLTGMPSRAARSARSAEARTAMPTSVRRRNTARAIITSGATTRAASSSAPKMIGSTVKLDVPGQVEGLGRRALPPEPGQEQAAGPEQGGQADGGDGQDQPGGVEEAADDQQLDEGADARGPPGGRRRGPPSSSSPRRRSGTPPSEVGTLPRSVWAKLMIRLAR